MRSTSRRGRAALIAAVCLLALTACTNVSPPPPSTNPTAVAPTHMSAGWTEIAAPAPGARVLTMVATGRTLLAFGSVPTGAARAPAAWTTTDLGTWTRLETHAVTAYGEVAQFIMGADADGRVVAFGQAYGGAHSNPRPTTWAGDLHRLDEHEQPYTLFGGEDAIGVTAMASSGGIALISGAWDGPHGYGAAVWLTKDGVRWTRIADAPGLSSAPGEQTFANSASWVADGFVLAGSVMSAGTTKPLVWRSPDGIHWTRSALSSPTDAAALASACGTAGCTTVGATLAASQQLRCWRTDTAGTQTAQSSGPGHGLIDVTQVVLFGDRALVVGSIDHVATLWSVGADCSGWSAIPTPARSEDAAAAVLGGHLILATTGPDASRLWTAPTG
ncbi:hypothetical protein [Microbacterium candidum]|uniref:Galactose oxidase n=1 Tax=Microbacterium candidum TaxID=3041922 RepID=A0ABT7MXC0_9MICO|nr:hypothetical protein [Microbacterium sp. ASV49]MDL9979085.1 hypothetical protein [Microbacterium sp. ASV49]